MSRQTFTLRRTKSLSLLSIILLAVSVWNWKVRSAEAAGALLFTPVPAGTTLFVTNTNDSGPGSLRAALVTANSDGVGDTIVISATGTITLQSALPALGERGVTIEGPGASNLRVRRNGDPGRDSFPRYSIFTVNAGVTVTIKDLTISHGWFANGGGINNAGTLTLINCVVSENMGDVSGAGIYSELDSTLILTNTTVTFNRRGIAAETVGGGIANYGAATISGSSISVNTARSGAGIYNDVEGTLTLNNSLVNSNLAIATGDASGGGILSAGNLTISSSTIQNNSSSLGGGLMIQQSSPVVSISNTTITGNNAFNHGGGIEIIRLNGFSGSLTQIGLNRVTISSNSGSNDGSGIYNAGNVSLESCTVSGNSGHGAAIITLLNSVTTINQSTVTQNRYDFSSAGLDCRLASATIGASIIAGNQGLDILGNIVSNDFNLLGSGANHLKPHDIETSNPKLTALGDYGGSVPTHALLRGSPALDHGPTTNPSTTDARGLPRSIDGDGDGLAVSDIGAFETQTYLVTNTNNSGDGSLRQVLLTNNSAGGGIVNFNISGTGVHTITPTADTLLQITKPVQLLGYSQPGATPNTAAMGNNATLLIEVSGALAGPGATGLYITAGGCVVEGLVINGFSSDSGIWLNGTGSNGSQIIGNRIGTDPTGALARPNYYGLTINSGSSNTISGNLFSGNSNGGIAIFESNAGQNKITGNYIGVDGDGQSAFPNTGNGILLSGSYDNDISKNLISGNSLNGISIEGATANNNRIVTNLIGTNAQGTLAIPNGAGIHLFNGSNNSIGGLFSGNGTAPGDGNVISGNRDGVIIGPDGAANNIVQGNLIGLASNGTTALGNSGPNAGHGVVIIASSGNLIGDTSGTVNPPVFTGRNRIANNSGPGVYVFSGTANTVRGNSIFANGTLGVDLGPVGLTLNDDKDLDSGANNLQNFPVLSTVVYDGFSGSSTAITGTLNSTPDTTFKLEFFASPNCDAGGHGEGQTLIGSGNATTDSTGNANLSFTFNTSDLTGQSLSAIATDPAGNTSEFSPCVVVTPRVRSVQFTSANFGVTEGTIATLTVSRIGNPAQGITVNYATANGPTNPASGGTACGAGVDYINANGTLTWSNNDLSNKTISVSICNNNVIDSLKNVSVTLSNPTNGATVGSPGIATLTIEDNDDPGPIDFANSINIAREGYGTAVINVVRTAADSGPVSVQYATVSGGSAVGGSSCDSAEVNYLNSTGTVSWAANDVSPKSIAITLCNDTVIEPDKTVVVTLSNPTGGARLGSNASTTLNIIDDDHIFTVTNTSDDGPGSLRQALVAANSFEPTDSSHINLNGLTGTINLLTALPDLNANIFIHGPRANLLSVARSNAPGTPEFRIFQINSGRRVSIGGLTIRNGLITDHGAGINNEGTADIEGCNIEGNTAAYGGGGISNAGTMTLNASAVVNNVSLNFGNISGGGGIFNYGDLRITNSTISGNLIDPNGHGFGYGGGIFNDGYAGPLVIINSTVTGNTATYPGNKFSFDQPGGGGIYQRLFPDYTVTITNSIIAGNSCPNAPDISGPIVSGDYNLIGNPSSAAITGVTSHNLTNVDARLAPLTNNGGPTPTHALLSNSPAIDSGNNQSAPVFDQRGLQRVADGNNDGSEIIDIGAFEVQSSCSMVLVTATVPDATVGTNYQLALEVSGGTPGYIFSVTSGALPNGLALSSEGTLFGTPTQSGNFTFVVTVGDASGCSRQREYTIQIAPAAPVCASDVTSLLTVIRSGFSQNLVTRRFRQTVTIRNDSQQAIVGPLVYAVDNLSLNALLYNPSGMTACSVPISPYVSLPTSAGQLLPGQTITLVLEFTNSNMRESITYSPRVLAGNAR